MPEPASNFRQLYDIGEPGFKLDDFSFLLLRLRLHGAVYRPDYFCIDATLLCEFESDKI